jgi:hypothetical protein
MSDTDHLVVHPLGRPARGINGHRGHRVTCTATDQTHLWVATDTEAILAPIVDYTRDGWPIVEPTL